MEGPSAPAIPYEDSFSALYGRIATTATSSTALGGDLPFSLFELLTMQVASTNPNSRLSQLEYEIIAVTAISYVAMAAHYGYTDITP